MLMFFKSHRDAESESVFNGQQSMANGQQSAFKKNPIFAL